MPMIIEKSCICQGQSRHTNRGNWPARIFNAFRSLLGQTLSHYRILKKAGRFSSLPTNQT